MSLFSVRRANPIDIGQANPWLQTFVAGRWFAPSQLDHGQHRRCSRRVRAPAGGRVTASPDTQGLTKCVMPPHASDDARLDLSSHRQAVRLSPEGSDSRPSGPSISGHSSTAGPGFAQRGSSRSREP